MDDSRTIRELEELADLFLTEAFEHAQSPAVRDESAKPAPPMSDPQASAPEPIEDEAAEDNDYAGVETRQDPSSSVLGATSTGQSGMKDTMHTPDPEPNSRLRLHQDDAENVVDEVDAADAADGAMTGLHETAGASGASGASGAERAVSVEAVFLGNLPGYAHPWLTQYAHHVARSAGAVAVLHLDDEQVDLDLVGEVDDITLNRASVAGDLTSTLMALVDNSASPVRRFLIHVAMTAGKDAANLVNGIDRWTLLSGADNTAVIAAYQLLKQMLDGRGAVGADGAARAGVRPDVGLMVLGSDEHISLDAARKVQTTASSFLKLDLRLIGQRRQMLPVQVRHLGSFVFGDAEGEASRSDEAAPGEDWASALSLLKGFGQAGTEQATREGTTSPVNEERRRPVISTERRPALSDDERRALSSGNFEPGDDEEDEAAARTAVRGSDHQVKTETAVKRTDKTVRPSVSVAPSADKAAVDRETKEEPPRSQSCDDPDPDLALFARQSGDAPGAIDLEARCPRQADVQVLLDQHGRLHLLAHQGGDESADAAMGRLMHAASWAREHVELLRLTQRQMHFDRDAQPMLHLFTSHARQAVALTRQDDERLKVHLLQQVQAGEASAWVCNSLN